MAAPRFGRDGKHTTAVFIKELVDGKVRYRREQYNIVRYNVDNESEPRTYMEGLPDPALRPGYSSVEYYDEILIEDRPHPSNRIGGADGKLSSTGT